MSRFVLRKVISILLTLFVVSLIVFIAARVVGDPRTTLLPDSATQDQIEELGRQLGLDKPLPQQYFTYIGQLLTGDFGESIIQRRPVATILAEQIPATLWLALVSFTIATVFGVAIGVLASVRRGTRFDKVTQTIGLTGQALPSFWLGIVLIFVFAVRLRWVPPSGMKGWSSVILPGVALGWYFLAANLRLMRSSMLDVMDSQYILTARARGIPNRSIVWRHAGRNALLPPLTFSGVTLGTLITGSLVIETVFAWPGLGKLAVDSVFSSDYPLLQGTVIVFTLMYMGASLFVDLLYGILDPRIRLA